MYNPHKRGLHPCPCKLTSANNTDSYYNCKFPYYLTIKVGWNVRRVSVLHNGLYLNYIGLIPDADWHYRDGNQTI